MRAVSTFGSLSLAAAGATLVLAQAFHPVLLAALQAGDTAAWLAMLLAGTFATGSYLLAAATLAALPQGNLIDLARTAAGEAGAILTGLAVTAGLTFHAGLILRQTAEMAVSAVYPHTPQTFAMVALVLCAYFGARGELSALVRFGRGLLPLIAAGILLIVAGSWGWGQMRFLLPLWGPGPVPLLAGSLWLTAFFGPLCLFLLMGAGELRDRRVARAGGMAVLGSLPLLVLLKVVLMMVYPLPLGALITFPLHEMARLVMGGRFFQRIEGVWVMLWMFGTAFHLAALLHVAAIAFTRAFGMSGHRRAVLPIVTWAVVVGLFPNDQARAIAWHLAAAPAGLALAFAWPLLLAGLAGIRRRLSHVP